MSSPKSQNFVAEMTGKNYSPGLRQLANAQLVSLNASKAAEITREWLQDLPSGMDASILFTAFLSTKEGTGALAGALTDVNIPEPLAKIGRQVMQQELPYYRNQDKEVILLKKVLEASGGVLPPEKMPQQLSEPQITQLAQEIKTTADPVLGEAIYRRTNLMCQNCHALGGAGGLIGPDLSSLGTSSPIDNIIQSLLVPNESIKEGYELQKITKKDGGVVMGYLISDGTSGVVIRNVAGMEESVPKSQIEQHENVPGSLMPPGLTSGLDKKEFIDLVGYLSKLGESGNFRVPNSVLVRRWRAMSGNDAWVSKIREEGMDHLVHPNTKSTLLPLYSTVAGDLPLEEVPIVKLGSEGEFSFLRFEIEVLSPGNVNLLFPSTAGIQAWAGPNQLSLNSDATQFELSAGIHQITLAIDRNKQKDGLFNIQLQEAEKSPAQTRLLMGR
jgi:putative heme-binding domain-containing protein